MISAREHLIVFSRFPVPGEAKTRLIPALGAEGTADLQRKMTEHTVAQARKTGAQIEVRWTGGGEEQMREWLGGDLQYTEQGAGDLGERMARAFREHFDAGAERVVIIGCDCPSNGWKNIQKSFQALDPKRSESAFCTPKKKRPEGEWQLSGCVIGPASDGGYYLIGLRKGRAISPSRACETGFAQQSNEAKRNGKAPRTARRAVPTKRETFPVELFQNIDWGTGRVLEQTLSAAPEKPALLEILDDVDLPDDIPAKISVIIPTLNEASIIFPLDQRERGWRYCDQQRNKVKWQTLEKVNEGFGVEIIVVDGGSTDGTVNEVQKLSPHLMRCGEGRAAQQNAGAAATSGEILLFLHADTELPDNWDFIIRNELKKSWVSLGAFRFGVRERLRGIAAVEWGTNIRSRFFHKPYGDQGLFLRRDTFETIGGFPDQLIMEDVALVRRARRLGKIVTVPETAITSGRRWQKRGVLRTTCINQLILLGASPQKLRRLYG